MAAYWTLTARLGSLRSNKCFNEHKGRRAMAAINSVTDLTNDGDVAVITLNSPPVNALSANVRDGLYEGFKAAIADDSVKSIVLICDGRTFIAGADISEACSTSRT
jgi:enoyl-CoA hydratase/carnithine racemase